MNHHKADLTEFNRWLQSTKDRLYVLGLDSQPIYFLQFTNTLPVLFYENLQNYCVISRKHQQLL